ncbi:MAG: hypothetical protein OXC31_22050 [Spirochaetaceae bacterium]|nr:hypothetical protein [Spirochaetaceae bacterium]
MLVGAQAVYVHTGDADFVATAPHTTDADQSRCSSLGRPRCSCPRSIKIAERAGDRVADKDALDVLRLLRAADTATLAARLADLADHAVSVKVTDEAVSKLAPLFGSPDAKGIGMAIRAAGPSDEADVISASFIALVSDLLAARRW